MSTLAFAMDQGARHSRESRNPFHEGHGFRGYSGSRLLRPVRLLAPLYGSDWSPSQRGLLLPSFQRVGCFPLLDMTTTVTGLLCWRDSHPLEWQLASLHWPGRAVQDGLPRSTNVRAASMYQASEVERFCSGPSWVS